MRLHRGMLIVADEVLYEIHSVDSDVLAVSVAPLPSQRLCYPSFSAFEHAVTAKQVSVIAESEFIIPTEFVVRCKAAHPDYESLHALLDANALNVASYLEGNIPDAAVEVDDILAATSLEDLQEQARKLQKDIEEKVTVEKNWERIVEDYQRRLAAIKPQFLR